MSVDHVSKTRPPVPCVYDHEKQASSNTRHTKYEEVYLVISKYDLLDSQPLGMQGNINLGAKGVVQGPCANPGMKDRDLRMEVVFERVGETYNLLPEQVSKTLADANLPAGFECACTIA